MGCVPALTRHHSCKRLSRPIAVDGKKKPCHNGGDFRGSPPYQNQMPTTHKQTDYEGLSTLDLVERYGSQCRELGSAGVRLKDSTDDVGSSKVPKAVRARYYSAIHSSDETKQALILRLGGTLSPEVTNRIAFMWLARQKAQYCCYTCKAEPKGGRGLQFWTDDLIGPQPLLLLMAWGGASVEKLKVAKQLCKALCRSCSKKRGAKLLATGNVDLTAYDVKVL